MNGKVQEFDNADKLFTSSENPLDHLSLSKYFLLK